MAKWRYKIPANISDIVDNTNTTNKKITSAEP